MKSSVSRGDILSKFGLVVCLCSSVLTTMWCFTGQDNYPEMDITCLDLSPFYLEKSRDNMDYWRRMRAPASQKISTDKFIQVSGSPNAGLAVPLAGWLHLCGSLAMHC